MSVVQIIFSPTGGTQKVADIITSDGGSLLKRSICQIPGPTLDPFSYNKMDIALIAVPSFGGRVPAPAVQRLEAIQACQAMGVIVCVYGNRAYEDTLIELNDAAQKSGFGVVAGIAAIAEHSIMHQYAEGRPDEQDSHSLRDFAKKILAKIPEGSSQPFQP